MKTLTVKKRIKLLRKGKKITNHSWEPHKYFVLDGVALVDQDNVHYSSYLVQVSDPDRIFIQYKKPKKDHDFSNAKKGPLMRDNSISIPIRLDSDVLAYFKKKIIRNSGGSYSSLMNDALKQHIEDQVLIKEAKCTNS